MLFAIFKASTCILKGDMSISKRFLFANQISASYSPNQEAMTPCSNIELYLQEEGGGKKEQVSLDIGRLNLPYAVLQFPFLKVTLKGEKRHKTRLL